MEKISGKTHHNKVTHFDLFSEKEGVDEVFDELYKDIQKERYPWCAEAKIFLQKQYIQYRKFLDKGYPKKFPREFYSLMWELTQVGFLAEHENKGLKLNVKQNTKPSSPDFCFDLEGNRFYYEATCPDPSGELSIRFPISKARETPHVENMERFCSAIRNKGDIKYFGEDGKGYKSFMEKKAGLIISASMAKIPFMNQVNNPEIYLRCLFGMTEMKFNVRRENEKTIFSNPFHEPQSNFKKISNQKIDGTETNIKMDYFSNDEFNHISAILISEKNLVFFPFMDLWKNGDCRNDYILVHNPHATTKLPVGFFNVACEVTAKITDKGMDILYR